MRKIVISLGMLVFVMAIIIVVTFFGSLIIPSLLHRSQPLTTNTTTTCTEQFDNQCIGNWTAYFSISVNYTGAWKASYNATGTIINNFSGNYTGTGDNSTQIVVDAYGVVVIMFCATAQKMDSSNSTLSLTVNFAGTGDPSTSLPFGSVQQCVSVGI